MFNNNRIAALFANLDAQYFKINTVVGQFKNSNAFGYGVYYVTSDNHNDPFHLYEGELVSRGRSKLWTINLANEPSSAITEASPHFTWRNKTDYAQWLFGKHINTR